MKSLSHILSRTTKKKSSNEDKNKQSSTSESHYQDIDLINDENHYQDIKDSSEKSSFIDVLRGLYNRIKGLIKAPAPSPQASKTLGFLNKNYKYKGSTLSETKMEGFYSRVIKNTVPNSSNTLMELGVEDAPQILTQSPEISVEEFLRKKGYYKLTDDSLVKNDSLELEKIYDLKDGSSIARF